MRETSIVEVGASLELFDAHGNFVNLDYRNFSTKIIIPLYSSIVLYKNNVQMFAFRMFTMLVGLYGAGHKLWL